MTIKIEHPMGGKMLSFNLITANAETHSFLGDNPELEHALYASVKEAIRLFQQRKAKS